jgi:hypothetical protein
MSELVQGEDSVHVENAQEEEDARWFFMSGGEPEYRVSSHLLLNLIGIY